MGFWIIVGHAIIETAIIIFLLFGFSFLLESILVVRIIGLLGGVVLVYFGISVLRDIYHTNISANFLDFSEEQNQRKDILKSKDLENPILGGIMVSMSNPYWWIWWATIGLAFMIQFNISFEQWPNLLAFFLGHEIGDLSWYLFISSLSFFGLRHLNKRLFYGVLMCCGIFMILFGIYLGSSPFIGSKG